MTSNDTRYKGQTFRYDRIDTVLNYDMSNNIADRQLPLTNLYNVNNNYWCDKDIRIQVDNKNRMETFLKTEEQVQ